MRTKAMVVEISRSPEPFEQRVEGVELGAPRARGAVGTACGQAAAQRLAALAQVDASPAQSSGGR